LGPVPLEKRSGLRRREAASAVSPSARSRTLAPTRYPRETYDRANSSPSRVQPCDEFGHSVTASPADGNGTPNGNRVAPPRAGLPACEAVHMLSDVRAILFDVFGTLVDWRTSVNRQLQAFGDREGIAANWQQITDDWRAEYQPAMEEVRSGRRAWTILDELHRESLERVLERHAVTGVADDDLAELTLAWHRLDPWPDVVPGLTQLATRYTVGTLSNGNTALLDDLVRHAGLPMRAILGAETARCYKPLPEAYLRNVALLSLEPHQVMLVAAHNGDLTAASSVGLRTGFIPRPVEHGPDQSADLTATADWDVIAQDLVRLAARMIQP
jgi:2-haloacid dehalogenase